MQGISNTCQHSDAFQHSTPASAIQPTYFTACRFSLPAACIALPARQPAHLQRDVVPPGARSRHAGTVVAEVIGHISSIPIWVRPQLLAHAFSHEAMQPRRPAAGMPLARRGRVQKQGWECRQGSAPQLMAAQTCGCCSAASAIPSTAGISR